MSWAPGRSGRLGIVAGSARGGAQRLARQPGDAAAEHLPLRRLRARRTRRPSAAGGRGRRVEVEQDPEDLRPRHAVDRGVVDLREQPDVLAALDPVDDVELPQRVRAVERPRDQPRDRLGDLPLVARRRHRAVADVEVEVEVRVLDPVRQVDAERHLGELPPERRQHVDALADEPADVLELELAARPRRRVVDRQARDVPVRAARLHREELRVQARQLAHRPTLSSGCDSLERTVPAERAQYTSRSRATGSRATTVRRERLSSAIETMSPSAPAAMRM